MKEVTKQTPYNQYPGRSFLCTVDEADKYVLENCEKPDLIEIWNNIHTKKLENKVWLDIHRNKIAQYKPDRTLLVIYS